MKSNGSSFETILEALIQQKQVLEDLQAENVTLRQQLTNLRAGRGIFVDILGTRIPLAGTPDTHVFDAVLHENILLPSAIEVTAPVPIVVPAMETDSSHQETTNIPAAPAADPALQPTASISSEALQMAGRETPLPGSDFVIEDVPENGVPMPVRSSSTFLEDALLAEFSRASTRHSGNWTGPITNGPLSNGPITNNPNLDEDEKAALRRELMGSYILE
jgi:hypothetical protein